MKNATNTTTTADDFEFNEIITEDESGTTWHLVPCEAIASCDKIAPENWQFAYFVWDEQPNSFHDGDAVVFGYGRYEDGDIDRMLDDPNAWNTYIVGDEERFRFPNGATLEDYLDSVYGLRNYTE